MSRAPTKRFGPLLYSTLLFGAVAAAYACLVQILPKLEESRLIRSLVADLRSNNPGARQAAVSALLRRGSDVAVPFLIEAARDPRGEVRSMALRCLANVSPEPSKVVPALVDAAGDEDEEVRLAVAFAMGRLIVSSARRFQASPDAPGGFEPGVRAEVLTALRRLLKDSSSRVRVSAAQALEDYGRDPGAVADLVKAADDEEREVRIAAAQTLLKVNGAGDRKAASTLLAMVADPGPIPDRMMILTSLSAATDDVRGRAATLLAELASGGEPTVIPDVMTCLIALGPQARAALPALDRMLDDKDPRLRAEVGMAVVMIEGKGSRRALEILARMIADAELTQEARQAALGMLRDDTPASLAGATPALIRQLGHGNVQVRRIALDLLSLIVDDTAAEMPAPVGKP